MSPGQGHRGLHVAEFRTAIESSALKTVGQYLLLVNQPGNAIGELNLTARARGLLLSEIKDPWRQKITANDGNIGRRLIGCRLFNDRSDLGGARISRS